MRLLRGFFILVFLTCLTSCITRKDLTYFQDIPTSDTTTHVISNSGLRTALYEPIIKSGDILNITIMSLNQESNIWFNAPVLPPSNAYPEKSLTQSTTGFLVDNTGNIQIPMVGDLKVDGLTTSQIRQSITEKLDKYLQSPSVSVRFSNFKITILGDVTRPGIYPIPNERVTLLEALGMAGDLTVFGQRKGVKIVREENGTNNIYTIDLTSKDVLNSPYMYLHPNDVIYVDPSSGKAANADNIYRIFPLIMSALNIIAIVVVGITK